MTIFSKTPGPSQGTCLPARTFVHRLPRPKKNCRCGTPSVARSPVREKWEHIWNHDTTSMKFTDIYRYLQILHKNCGTKKNIASKTPWLHEENKWKEWDLDGVIHPLLIAFQCFSWYTGKDHYIGAVIWKRLKKVCFPIMHQQFQIGFKSNSTLNWYSSVVIRGSDAIKKLGVQNVEKNLATMNVRGERAELYQTEVNKRS